MSRLVENTNNKLVIMRLSTFFCDFGKKHNIDLLLCFIATGVEITYMRYNFTPFVREIITHYFTPITTAGQC